MKHQFKNTEAQVRLDKAISQELPDMTRSQIQKLIKEASVHINGQEARKNGQILEDGDEISIDMPQKEQSMEYFDIPLDIVFEDDYIIVVNKAKDLVVHPAIGHENDTLVNALLKKTDDPQPVHRLDKDTTGLIIMAKGAENKEKFQTIFKSREIKKTYIALLLGKLEPKTGLIDAPIARHETDRLKMSVRKTNKAREAQTAFTVLQDYSIKEGNDGIRCSLVEFDLLTGRTHQIRVHSQSIKHPVIGDAEYGDKYANQFFKDNFGVTTQFLHAKTLSFTHPITGEQMQFSADLPPDLQEILDRICP